MTEPPTETKRRAMQAQRERDTGPELALRRVLHGRGLRYFVHRRPLAGMRREADIVFVGPRVAVFADGCFWHGCPEHRTLPKRNAEWWNAKLKRNMERDADTDRQLLAAGWEVLRVWEHESTDDAADRVEKVVRRRLSGRIIAAPPELKL